MNTREAALEAVDVASPFPMLLATPMSARVVTVVNLVVVMLKVITPVFVLSPLQVALPELTRVTFNLPVLPSVKLPLQTLPPVIVRVAAVAEEFVTEPVPSSCPTGWVVPLRSKVAPVRTIRFRPPVAPILLPVAIFTVPSRILMDTPPAEDSALTAFRTKVPRPLFVKPPVELTNIGVSRFRMSLAPLTRNTKAPLPPEVMPAPPVMVAVPPDCSIGASPFAPSWMVRVCPESKVRLLVVSLSDEMVRSVCAEIAPVTKLWLREVSVAAPAAALTNPLVTP